MKKIMFLILFLASVCFGAVSDTSIYQIYNGGSTTFAVPYTFDSSDTTVIKVYEIDDSTTPATVTLQTEGAGNDYTIVGTNVVFNSATAATSRIYVGRGTPLITTYDPIVTARPDVEAIEAQLDELVKQIQELDERVDRGLVLNIGATASGTVPDAVASNVLAWNSGATALENVALSSSSTFTSSSTNDNELIRSNGTAGNIQGSGITVDDSDNVSGIGTLAVGGAVSGVTNLTMTGAISGTTNLTMTGALSGASIDADSNTVTNIDNNEIKAAAGINVNKLEALTASRAMVTDGSGFASASSVTSTELGYLSGVTSGIQSQIDTVSSSGRLIAVNVYTSSDTYTKATNDPNFVIIECVGGGGGGGAVPTSGASEAAQGAGGGGGAYSKAFVLASALSSSETVTVGAGGAGGAAGDNNGSNGSVSSLGSHCTAPGGFGGAHGDDTTGYDRSIGGLGGAAGVGDISIPGTRGNDGIEADGRPMGANNGGPSHFSGVAVTSGSASDGADGVAYGGGGAGANNKNSTDGTERPGGDGADGVVIVWEYE